jgi:hypothetical protein
MATLSNNFGAKTSKNEPEFFECISCDYKCSKKYNWDRHVLTAKHIKATNCNKMATKNEQNEQIEEFLCCNNCNKLYTNRTSLWRHNKKCKYICMDECINQQNKISESDKDELIITLLKQNADLIKGQQNILIEQQNMMIKLTENGINNCNNTTTTHTNSHNKAFNLQFFLNETCKDAMNIMDFVESIKLELTDLENVGQVGYIEGISNIIVSNLKKLDITKRPVHCTDKKRETMYVKDENKWEKDEENAKLHKLVKKVTSKNQRLIPKFKEKHPDCLQYHSDYSDQYSKIVYESMGGKGDDDFEKQEKIIKKISKEVVIEK